MGVWETTRGELAVASDREFERLVIPLLRILHPEFIQPVPLLHLDRAGIDLVVWSDGPAFPWAIQCKGFKEKEISESQVDQILKSIETFRKSQFACEQYALLHNRTGENQEATKAIEGALRKLVQEGKAKVTHLWDRQKFISTVRTRLQAIIVERIREDTDRYAAEQEGLFLFGATYVPTTPISEKTVLFERSQPMKMIDNPSVSNRVVSELLLESAGIRWTLLTGPFGTGKTTAALRAARSRGHSVVYIRAEDITVRGGGVGTNVLLARILDAALLFDDFDDETRQVASKLAGETLAQVLRRKDNEFVLIIDGLDENRMYARADGMRRLTNELAELACAVALTTRREHLDSTFSNFEAAFAELSRKGGAKRAGRLLNFEMWSDVEIQELIAATIARAPIGQATQLRNFADTIRTGQARIFYGDLLQHPLFLQMILEEVASGTIERRNRSELIQNWIERKLDRDLNAERVTPTVVGDRGTFVEKMMRLHELVANEMTTIGSDGLRVLTEQIDSTAVEAIARSLFGDVRIDIADILGCSLLSAVSHRLRGTMPIKFLLRICHEYFLAAHLRRQGASPTPYPATVASFWDELANIHSGHRK